jgi:hypothetical protein
VTFADLAPRVAARLIEQESGRRLAEIRVRLPKRMEDWSRAQAALYQAARLPDYKDMEPYQRRPFEARAREVLDLLDELAVRALDQATGEMVGA